MTLPLEKKVFILNAIIWFCIGGFVTTFITLQIQDKYVIKPYQQEIIKEVESL